MERIIQYLDILEDSFYVVALLAERIRRIAFGFCILAATVLAVGLGVVLALTEPSAGLAVAAILTVTVLYRSATARTTLAHPPLHG